MGGSAHQTTVPPRDGFDLCHSHTRAALSLLLRTILSRGALARAKLQTQFTPTTEIGLIRLGFGITELEACNR